jgi:hypothetical protein
MIDLAVEFGFPIKIFNLFLQTEYIATNTPYGKETGRLTPLEYWKENYVNLAEFIPKLKHMCSSEIVHYAKDGKYGISYGFIIKGIEVLLADTSKGAYYQSEICLKNCPYFKGMCEKGFYNPHVSSNLVLYPDDCLNENLRWNLKGKGYEQKVDSITELLSLFADVQFVKARARPIDNLLKDDRYEKT